MVYVFGMEGVPIFELLFVLMLLMIVGLVVLILEIKRMVKLLAQEKSDLRRFEDDLSTLETKKPDSRVVGVAQNARNNGLSHTQIHHTLRANGFNDNAASQIMSRI